MEIPVVDDRPVFPAGHVGSGLLRRSVVMSGRYRSLRSAGVRHELRGLRGAPRKVLNRLPGVDAKVNFATEKARHHRHTRGHGGRRHSRAIRKAGFDVAHRCLELGIGGMSCAACAARIEKVVVDCRASKAASISAAETARVRYTPGLTDPAAIVGAIAKAGFSRHADRRS